MGTFQAKRATDSISLQSMGEVWQGPCIESGVQVALDFIGKRGSAIGVAKAARIQYAREILERELLPHIGITEYCETQKVPLPFTNAHTNESKEFAQGPCQGALDRAGTRRWLLRLSTSKDPIT